MNFTFAHNNLNVYDLDASLRFYKEALGLTVTRTKEADDGSFKLVYLGDSTTPHKLELTWLRDMDRPYNLGDNEIHLAFETDDFDAASDELCFRPLYPSLNSHSLFVWKKYQSFSLTVTKFIDFISKEIKKL